jgi:hypothetical protein
MILLVFLLFIPAIISLLDFIFFLFGRKALTNGILAAVFCYGIIPYVFLFATDISLSNDCCGESAFFSPGHRLTAYVIITFCVLNYFYCCFRKTIAPPIIEIAANTLLIISSIFNVFFAIHLDKTEGPLWLAGNVPIILLNIMMLARNQQLFIEQLQTQERSSFGLINRWAWSILNAPPLLKYPILLILCLPVLVLISAFLLLFGQKPDSVTRAFTDTYKHGLSQLDQECAGVQCGGHYLCTIAAKGHHTIVKPLREGKREKGRIICNRQLLVANAFEEALQEKFPSIHYFIRTRYDRIGNILHKHYWIFNNKFVSDLVYLLMKPLEWSFVFVLYCCDKDPENRIARQYTGIRKQA